MIAYLTVAGFVGLLATKLNRPLTVANTTLPAAALPSVGFGTNREVQLTVNVPNAAQTGREDVTVYYNRLDLGYLNTVLFPKALALPEGIKMHALLPYLNLAMGMEFTTNDLEDTLQSAQTDPSYFTVTLLAKTGSPRFKGTCTITFARKPPLSTAFTTNNLGSM